MTRAGLGAEWYMLSVGMIEAGLLDAIPANGEGSLLSYRLSG